MDIEKLIGRIASALQLSDLERTAFIGTLKDGEEMIGETEVADKVAELVNRQLKAAKEANLKRGKREGFAPVKAWLKEKGVPVDDEMQVSEMLSSVEEHFQSKQPSGVEGDAAKKLTKEELAQLPEVKALMNSAYERGGAEIKGEFEKVKAEYDTFKKEAKRQEVGEITRRVITEALEVGDVLLEPTGVQGVSKDKRIATVLRLFDIGKIGVIQAKDGRKVPVFLDDNGEPEEDDLGNYKEVSKAAVTEAQAIFGPRGVDPNKGGGDPKPSNGKPQKYVPVYTFANDAEFTTQKNSERDPAKRLQMTLDFQHQQQQKAAGN